MANYTVTTTNNTKSFHGYSGEWRNEGAFAIIKNDGSVVTWGDSSYGGDSSAVQSQLNGAVDVTQIFPTNH